MRANNNASSDETEEISALLTILAIGSRDIKEGAVAPLEEVIERMRRGRTRPTT